MVASTKTVFTACAILVYIFAFEVRTTNSKYKNQAPLRYYKDGQVIIGALFSIHSKMPGQKTCDKFSSDGFGFAQTLAFAVDQINKNTQLLPNVTLGYDIRDYCNYPLEAVSATYDFVNNWPSNRIVAVIGPEDSSTALKIVALLNVKKIPLVSFAASSQELTNPMFSNFFRTIPPDTHQARALADLIDHFNWSYIAIVAVDDSYGRYGTREIENEANKRSTFCIAFTEYITSTGYNNKIKHIVKRLKDQQNIKTIVLWATEVASKRFLEEAKSQKLYGRTFLISDSLATNDDSYFDDYFQILRGCFGMNPRYEQYNEYVNYMKNTTPKSTNHSEVWRVFWEHEFQCTFSNNATPCYNYNNRTMSESTLKKIYNAFGSKVADAVYAIAYALHGIDRCTNVSQWQEGYSRLMDPIEVTKRLHNVSFDGFSGKTEFDKNGNPLFSWYDIINAQDIAGTVMKKNVGRWNQNIYLHDEEVQWSEKYPTISVCSTDCGPGTKKIQTTSCCWKCSECEDSISKIYNSENCTKCSEKQKPNNDNTECVNLMLENMQLTDPAGIFLLAMSILGLVITAGSLFVFIRVWSSPIVKASNRELSCVLFVAIFISFVMAIFYLDLPSTALCLVTSPLRYVLNSICVTVLFLKTERLIHAFTLHSQHSNSTWLVCKRFRFGRSPFVAISLLNIVQVTLAVLSAVLDPAVVEETVKPGHSIILKCVPYQTTIGKVLDIALLCYLVIMVIISTSYSFKARKIPENYNEGRCIVFSLYVIILSWIVYYPVHFTLDGMYVSVVSNASTLLCSYGLLVCIFFPKLYIIFWHPEKNTLEYARAQISKHTMAKSSIIYHKDAAARRSNIPVSTGSDFASDCTRSHVAL